MRLSHHIRASLIAVMAIVGASVSSAAYADSGTIVIRVFKAGWFVGGSGGSGTLTFHGRQYPLSIGGLSAGLPQAPTTALFGLVHGLIGLCQQFLRQLRAVAERNPDRHPDALPLPEQRDRLGHQRDAFVGHRPGRQPGVARQVTEQQHELVAAHARQ